MKAYAKGEMVIIEVKARNKGTEIKTESGLILGKLEEGEIPLTGTIVSVGDGVPSDEISINDVVLLPNGKLQNVPDPRVIEGSMKREDPDAAKMVTTHYKNICVVYT